MNITCRYPTGKVTMISIIGTDSIETMIKKISDVDELNPHAVKLLFCGEELLNTKGLVDGSEVEVTLCELGKLRSALDNVTEGHLDSNGLHIAIRKGNLRAVKLLLDHHGESIANTPNKNGSPPLMAAAYYCNNGDIIAALLDAGADPTFKSEKNMTPTAISAQYDHHHSLRKLLTVCDVDNELLCTAAYFGSEQCTKLLVRMPVDVNFKSEYLDIDRRGKTPLFLAAEYGHEEICQMLLEAGADSSIRCNGVTAVDIARKKNFTDVVLVINAH
eukprot:TRINITY_DN767_c3_g1_i1.p1 TRINITY_DN767_c3_g1~~TRINITY_DN767_c3_g1_i1.p1  ORF type:complete len:290 (+),score=52.48 TRINITY_DN767_c3_g1_i1:51-872(+)